MLMRFRPLVALGLVFWISTVGLAPLLAVGSGPRWERGEFVAIAGDEAFVYDAQEPSLWRVDLATGNRSRWISLETRLADFVGLGDGVHLAALTTNNGVLRISTRTGEVQVVKPNTESLTLRQTPGVRRGALVAARDPETLWLIDFADFFNPMVNGEMPYPVLKHYSPISGRSQLFRRPTNPKFPTEAEPEFGFNDTVGLFRIAVDPAEKRLASYVFNLRSQNITLTDLASLESRRVYFSGSNGPWPVPFRDVADLGWEANGQRLLVLDRDLEALVALDVGELKTAIFSGKAYGATTELVGTGPAFDRPGDLATFPGGQAALVFDAGHQSLLRVDLTTGARTLVSGTLVAAKPRSKIPSAAEQQLLFYRFKTKNFLELLRTTIDMGYELAEIYDYCRHEDEPALDLLRFRVLHDDPDGEVMSFARYYIREREDPAALKAILNRIDEIPGGVRGTVLDFLHYGRTLRIPKVELPDDLELAKLSSAERVRLLALAMSGPSEEQLKTFDRATQARYRFGVGRPRTAQELQQFDRAETAIRRFGGVRADELPGN